MRKTKIISTLGPATERPELLREMISAGVNVFRLNMSHATHDWVRAIVPQIREIAEELDTIVGVLMDTQGPAIRTGDLPAKLDLKPGDIFDFTIRGERSEEVYSVGVNYDGLIDDISVGDTVLVDNGVIHMRVIEKRGARIRCQVLTEGTLGNRRHINLPGVKVNLPPLTAKDHADIAVGAQLGVDFLALSFCREANDIEMLRAVLREHQSSARIVAKIEDQLAVKNINEIIRVTDLVMVARGDLGIECPMEDLPIIQRRIVKRCITMGVPVIVATHMLESMITNPVPTRAEVTDVANAVYEEADAIMLSGESSIGKYPLKCVQVLVRIAERLERSGGLGLAAGAILENDRQKTVRSAVTLANSLTNSKILIFTRRGVMADYVANLRPLHSDIHAFAASRELCPRLALNRGVQAHYLPFDQNPVTTIAAAEKCLGEKRLIKSGDHLVIIADILAGEDRFDSIQLRIVR